MKIPQNKIDEVASATDIVDIISQYTHLKKGGKNFMGRCPFHEERTPSFSVSQEKGVYHCFGCGKSGNLFSFIMDKDNVTFFEAVKMLAERANIRIEYEEGDTDDRNQIQVLFEIHTKAAKYFYENLMAKDGAYAREYFSQRGINEATIKKFGLGFSLRGKDDLHKILVNEYSVEDIMASGLIISIDKGEYKDRFRGRLMFPIISESSKVVGFGARKLYDEEYDAGKYVNSPETRIYNKSRILYGLNFAKEAIKKTGYAILVEGYMDLISLFQNEIGNVVASSGTSLTGLQVKILSRYTKEIVLVFDSDTAGKKASYRGIEIILENDLNVSIITLPAGFDPDSFIKKSGKDEFTKHLEGRKSVINYIAEKFQEENKLTTPEGKTEFVRELIMLIARMKDPIKRDFYIKDIGERFSIYESLLRKELGNYLSLRRQGLTRDVSPQLSATDASIPLSVTLSRTELMLIKLLLESDEKTRQYLADNLEVEYISDADVVRIVNYIMVNLKNPERLNYANIINQYKEERVRAIIGRLGLADSAQSNGSGTVSSAEQLLKELRLMYVMKQIKETEEKIKISQGKSSETSGLSKELQELINERISLEREIKSSPQFQSH